MRVDGLGLKGAKGAFARNAGEIAIQGWHVKREWAVPLVKEGQRSRRCLVRVGAVVREREWVEVVVEKESEVASVLWYARDEGGGGGVEWSTFSKRWRRSTEASEHVVQPRGRLVLAGIA
jgi:hypothetical protein